MNQCFFCGQYFEPPEDAKDIEICKDCAEVLKEANIYANKEQEQDANII